MYRITSTTDGQHIGEVFSSVEKGQILTFVDGDVVPVDEVFHSEGGNRLIAISPNYQIVFSKES